MFTGKEKDIIRFTIKEKLKIAKEVTRCAISEQKTLCKETERVLESILAKLK